ncbi:MAG: hypothetical protein Q8P40_09555 [Nitrospirota bacterium]|nr:hypothetical protein [Nitrospirota bacterium]
MGVILSTDWIFCPDCRLYFITGEGYANHPCVKNVIPFEPPIEPQVKTPLTANRRAFRRKPNLNPRCPECNGITRNQGTVVTKKKGIRQIFRCTECASSFRLPYTHPDISAGMEVTVDEPIGKGAVNLIAYGKLLQKEVCRLEENHHQEGKTDKWGAPTTLSRLGRIEQHHTAI